MPVLNTLRAIARTSAANADKSGSTRFKGHLIDEVHPKDRKKMDLIDEFTRTEILSKEQRHAHEEYLVQYDDLDEQLQHGVTKDAITGLMSRRITQMWDKISDKYKQKFEQCPSPEMPPEPPLRRYSSSRLSQVEATRPETILEEP